MAPPRSGVATDATIPNFARVHLAHAVVQDVAAAAGVALLHLKGPRSPRSPAGVATERRRRRAGPPRRLRATRARARGPRLGALLGSGDGLGLQARGQLVAPRLGVRRPARPLARGDDRPRGDVRRPRRGKHSSARSPTVRARSRARTPSCSCCCCTPPGPRTRSTSSSPGPASRRSDAPPCSPWPTGSGPGSRWPPPSASSRTTAVTRTTRCGTTTATAAAASTSGGRAISPPPPGASAPRVLVDAAQVNRDHLRIRLGRTPTRRELRHAQLSRLATLARELRRQAVGRRTP